MKKHLTKQCATSSVTSKYQTVIPKNIRKELGIKINEELLWCVLTQNNKQPSIVVTPKPKNWAAYLSGLGKEVWKNVDTDQYLKQLKKEWRS
ncbi:MAG TPA: AbrB/MazE/SpoVT family DNA-binding domain-containing protein [Patescibacteria group bacterium]|nr:AbrB/MazE/SpoVT family DNA-binding domain-containing protein [Patescibacteria group bacterium]